jgi:hypothetical protein
MEIAILGCGPAGLLAAHGAVQMGHKPFIFSKKVKSMIPGAVYLHEEIPGMTAGQPDGQVTFRREGSREGYAAKIYGDAKAPVSWDTFDAGTYPAWSMQALYDRLWDEYGDSVLDTDIDQGTIKYIKAEYPLVISSIPAKVLCHSPYHFFNGAAVWITETAWRDCPDDTIMYNGDISIPWYRTSRIFGYEATEYGAPVEGAFAGTKPTGTNCDCHAEIERVGRFGRWEKGVLVHHAFRQAMEAIEWKAGTGAALR